jgi:hypothetical protein
MILSKITYFILKLKLMAVFLNKFEQCGLDRNCLMARPAEHPHLNFILLNFFVGWIRSRTLPTFLTTRSKTVLLSYMGFHDRGIAEVLILHKNTVMKWYPFTGRCGLLSPGAQPGLSRGMPDHPRPPGHALLRESLLPAPVVRQARPWGESSSRAPAQLPPSS